ncbi:hypothetical protein DPMN_046462 [Dreissena polymorpha]|uniref:Uncharacterized protein n=1 Tax=Dreissena polymorpha TaxID=45954 RepID=A0A9D4D7U1_DREPO|nr:hypothetical protein DPMN_046462 [Dreissena polymorpha]
MPILIVGNNLLSLRRALSHLTPSEPLCTAFLSDDILSSFFRPSTLALWFESKKWSLQQNV